MKADIAKFIDHTNLKADATAADIDRLCREADENGFASVCVNPCWVPRCRDALADSEVAVCTVIGFPLGATSTAAKVAEALQAIEDGADELDVVLNQGLVKSNRRACFDELKEVVKVHASINNISVLILFNYFFTYFISFVKDISYDFF